MAGLTSKEQRTILTSMVRQGATLVEKKNGTIIQFPQGETAMVHRTPSDFNGHKPIRSIVLRNGFEWPFDGQRPNKKIPQKEITMSSLSVSDTTHLISFLQDQGAVIENRGSKTLVRFPNGSQTVLHADGGALESIRTDVRNAGLYWPWDSEAQRAEHSKPFTMADLAKVATPRRAKAPAVKIVPAPIELAEKKRNPSVGDADILMLDYLSSLTQTTVKQAGEATGLSFPTIVKRLRSLGWLQGPNRHLGIWVSPDWKGTLPGSEPKAKPRTKAVTKPVVPTFIAPAMSEYPEIEKARTALTALATAKPPVAPVSPSRAVTTVPVVTQVEFLDPRDSYTANLSNIGHLTVDQLSAAYNSAGLEFEIRLWKESK